MIRYPLPNQTTICPYFLLLKKKGLSLSMRIEKIFIYFNQKKKKNVSFLKIGEFIFKIICPLIKFTFFLNITSTIFSQ